MADEVETVIDPGYRAAGAIVIESDDADDLPSVLASEPSNVDELVKTFTSFHEHTAQLSRDPLTRKAAIESLTKGWSAATFLEQVRKAG